MSTDVCLTSCFQQKPPPIYDLIDDGLDDIDWHNIDESLLNRQSKRPGDELNESSKRFKS